MTTCAAHGWNQPCYTCARLQRHEDERRRYIWQLGHTLATMSDKAITVRTPRHRPFVIKTPRGFVPEVDPVTREATGRARQFVVAGDGFRPSAQDIEHPDVVEVDSVTYR